MERINENMKQRRPEENRPHKQQSRRHEERYAVHVAYELFNQNELLKEILREDIAEGM